MKLSDLVSSSLSRNGGLVLAKIGRRISSFLWSVHCAFEDKAETFALRFDADSEDDGCVCFGVMCLFIIAFLLICTVYGLFYFGHFFEIGRVTDKFFESIVGDWKILVHLSIVPVAALQFFLYHLLIQCHRVVSGYL